MLKKISKSPSFGFTLTELLMGIAILGIITAIAIPSLSDLLIRNRVDNQVTDLHRLLLTARNSAINSGKNVTLCPLTANTCTSNWQNELSVFINDGTTLAGNKVYSNDGNDNNLVSNEKIIKSKSPSKIGDTLEFDQTVIIFAPTGKVIAGGSGIFSYCPSGYPLLARGVSISLSGRISVSADSDSDGRDEDRNGVDITCS